MKTSRKKINCHLICNCTLQLLMAIMCLVAGNKLMAQLPTSLSVSDTRNGDSVPSAYKHIARFDFKYRNVIHAPGTGTYNGLLTLAPWSDASGGPSYQMSFDPSGIFLRQGNYTSNTWSVWTKFVVEKNGLTTLGNGSITSGLNVNGNIKAREVNVTTANWADDVFDKGYPLPTLKDLDREIKQKGHLPDMPSTKQVLQDGINVGEMNKKLLRKIEELTLYIIDQNKRIIVLESKMKTLSD